MTNNKYKIIIYATAFLLLANMVFTALLWQKSIHDIHEGPSSRNRGRFHFDDLGFDSAQKFQLENQLVQHFNQLDELKNRERTIKKSLIEMLKSNTFDSTVVLQNITQAAQIKFQMDTSVFYHFKRVRNICNASQLSKLDSNIEHLLLPPPPNFQGGERRDNDRFEEMNRRSSDRPIPGKNKRAWRPFPREENDFENRPRPLDHSAGRAVDDIRPDGPPPPRHRFDHPPGRPPGPPQGPHPEAF